VFARIPMLRCPIINLVNRFRYRRSVSGSLWLRVGSGGLLVATFLVLAINMKKKHNGKKNRSIEENDGQSSPKGKLTEKFS